jgi:type 1 fimbria pilin
MRSPAVWLMVLGTVVSATSAANAAADVTVKGEVVEIACSISKGAAGRGDAHAACALDCARRGEPLAVLADDAVFEITGDFSTNKNARLLDFVAKSVTVTGTLIEHDGKKRLNIKTIRLN